MHQKKPRLSRPQRPHLPNTLRSGKNLSRWMRERLLHLQKRRMQNLPPPSRASCLSLNSQSHSSRSNNHSCLGRPRPGKRKARVTEHFDPEGIFPLDILVVFIYPHTTPLDSLPCIICSSTRRSFSVSIHRDANPSVHVCKWLPRVCNALFPTSPDQASL